MASTPKKAAQPAIVMNPPPVPAVEAPAPVATAVVSAPAETPVPAVLEQPFAAPVEASVPAPAAAAAALAAEPMKVEAMRNEPVASEAAKAVETPMLAVKHMQENVRSMVEKGIAETRARYALAKSNADEASAALEASYGAARDGVMAFNVKTIEAFKAGAEANFDLIKSMASVKSMSELVTLQTEFARKRFEHASASGKEMAELARKVADETVAPLKAQVAKSFKIAV